MSTDTALLRGVDGFVRGLEALGRPVTRAGSMICFTLTALAGPLAGQELDTGVAAAELSGWPARPPHWVHLPSTITIRPTNARPSPYPGWTMHSRNIPGWGNHPDPVAEWIAHVAGVLTNAVPS